MFRGGYVWNFAYGAQAELDSITDSLGRTLSFEWYYSLDANNSGILKPRSIETIQLPDGTTLSYTYESYQGTQSGSQRYSRLHRFERRTAGGSLVDAESYLYEDADLPTALTGLIDHASVRFATWAYDNAGHAVLAEHADGAERTTITYSDSGSTGQYHYRTVTNPLGKQTGYTFRKLTAGSNKELLLQSVTGQPSANCVGTARSFTYTSNRITSAIDEAGSETRYTYDANGRVATMTEAYGTPLQRTTSYTWHSTFGVPTQIVRPGLTKTFSYDTAGRLLTETHTDTTTHTVPYLTNGQTRQWIYGYNAQGLRSSVNGPLPGSADITLYEYNPAGYPQKMTNAAGHEWEATSFDGAGRPLQIQDPNGLVSTVTYDGVGRMTNLVNGGLSFGSQFDDVGNLTRITFPGSEWIEYTFDDARRITDIHDQSGNHIHYTLDVAGNRIQQDMYDPYNVMTATQSRVYDELSRLIRFIGASAQVTDFGYDLRGHRVSETRPSNATTMREFDKLDRLAKITDAASGITLYGYNALGNVTSVTDPRGKVTSYVYNGFGDLIQETSPDRGTTVNTWDAAGNLLTRTDARGKTGTYVYDLLNRATSLTYPDQAITYVHDTGTNQQGRLTQITDASGSTSWTYDSLGRITSRVQNMGITKSLGYTYATNGLPETVTLPSGNTITYAYANGKISSITLNGSITILSNVLYQPFGLTNGWTWGNNTLAVREYDQDGMLTQLDSAELKTYSHDDDSRITQIQNSSIPSLTQNLGYDSLDRLTSATGPNVNQSWSYDSNGNRLSQGGAQSSTYTVASTSNRLSSISGALTRTYQYDAAGHVTGDSTATFVYNDAGRLVSATKGGITTSYFVNALGQRVKKTTSATSWYVMYDDQGRVVGEYDSSDALIQETIWLGRVPVATIRPVGAGVALYYVHADHLSTPRLVTRPSDNVIVWRWDSDPFGTWIANEDPDGDSTLFAYNLRFPGQYFDAETGLHYNYYRDYDPVIGRYMQSDPIGLRGGLNTFAYVRNRPAAFMDLFGLQEETPSEKSHEDEWPTPKARKNPTNGEDAAAESSKFDLICNAITNRLNEKDKARREGRWSDYAIAIQAAARAWARYYAEMGVEPPSVTDDPGPNTAPRIDDATVPSSDPATTPHVDPPPHIDF